ncbi:MAG: hypothetical protein K2X81_03455 [Candidatus Obscuribacterales bacterium]|jgi:tetratricopeptide (TPR) repeat protein|nr:hypothetical protein [Candidatus Obscuribacterales bacterium]
MPSFLAHTSIQAVRISILLSTLAVFGHPPVKAEGSGWLERNMIRKLMKTDKLHSFSKTAFDLPRQKISQRLSSKGSIAYRTEDFSKAKQSFGWAAMVDPTNTDAFLAKAKTEWILAERNEAIKDLYLGLGITNSDESFHYNPKCQQLILKCFANNIKLSSANLGINNSPGTFAWDSRADLAYLPFQKAAYWFREADFNIFFGYHACEAYQRKYDMLAKVFESSLADVVEQEATQCGCSLVKFIKPCPKKKESPLLGDPIATTFQQSAI